MLQAKLFASRHNQACVRGGYDILITYPEVAEKLKDELYGVIILIPVGHFEFEIDRFKDFETGELIKKYSRNKAEMLREFSNYITRVDGNKVVASVKISKLKELMVALADDSENLIVDAKRDGEPYQYVLPLPLKAKPPVKLKYRNGVLEVRARKE